MANIRYDKSLYASNDSNPHHEGGRENTKPIRGDFFRPSTVRIQRITTMRFREDNEPRREVKVMEPEPEVPVLTQEDSEFLKSIHIKE